MTIQQTTSAAQQKRLEAFALDSDKHPHNPSNAGLAATFQKDCISKRATIVPPVASKDQTATFWNKFTAWLYQTEPSNSESLNSSPQTDAAKSTNPVSLRPVLDEPEDMPPELKEAKLPPVAKKKPLRETFTHAQVAEAVTRMSQQTLDEVLCIIIKGQIELEKENALVAENTLDTYQKIKTLQEKVLDEIKDALMKDEKFLNNCQWAKTAAFAVSGAVATFVTFGLFAPVGILGALATYGPMAIAAITTGTKAYADQCLSEDEAQHEQYRNAERSLSLRIEDTQETLMSAAEKDQLFKERLVQFVKRLSKMNQLVMQK